jgi:lipopolysaccharide export system permease protein
MLFHSSIRKELARSFGATLLVLFTIVVTMMLIRTLGLATSGGVDPKEVMLVLGYTVVGRLHVILTMALFIAVVSVLTRMHSDSEMVIWMGSGRGLVAVVSPVFRFAWPVLLTMGVLVLVAWPWANQQAADLRDRFAQRGDLQRVQPGQFQTNAAGNRVFFIDKDTADGTQGRNVFISTTSAHGESTVSAQAATLGSDADGQHLLLKNGQRLEFSNHSGTLKVSEFEEYQVRVTDNRLDDNTEGGMKTRSTWLLLGDDSLPARAELTWRLGLVLCAVNVLLVGIAIASANPRGGRSGNVAFAVFAFLFYFNLLNLGETWVGRGRVGALEWTLGLHGTVTVLALLWLVKRHEGISVRAAVRRLLGGHA